MKRAAFRLLPIVGLLLWQFAAAATTAASPSAQVVHHASSPFYDDIFVVDENGTRSLRFRSAGDDAQSLIRPGHPEQLPMPYLRSAAVGLAMPEQVERALMIGLGGGAFANYIQVRLPDAYTDAVEIDPVVADIAREYFAVTEGEQLTVHVRDAVDFVREKRAPYNFILLDAYDADEIPEPLTTNSFFRALRGNLASDGVMVANIAISSTRRTRELIRKLAGHFHYCAHLRSPPRFNDVLLLSLDPLPDVAEMRDRAARFDVPPSAEIGLQHYAATATPCTEPAQ